MEKKQYEAVPIGESFILAGDIGGTNTNIALVGYTQATFAKAAQFVICAETITPTVSITRFMRPLLESVHWIRSLYPDLPIDAVCISGAGPIKENYCKLTNADWDIDGNLIEAELGIKTFVINDFAALSYGIPYLDVDKTESILQLPAPNGSYPKPEGKNKAVIGAGSGLGVGFIPFIAGRYRACASEGGHFDFPAFDEESTELMIWLRSRLGIHPGMERFVSGKGLEYVFLFLVEKEKPQIDETLKMILDAPESKRPYYISKNVETNVFCDRVHRLYRKIYGKMAGNYAAVFLPEGGLYIAGGVIAKDQRHFLKDSTFMEAFSINHKANISQMLQRFPVYIVRDYSTSLLGAAAAAVALLEE